MASDKFGNNPVAPLYNATGRNPRDMDMGNPGKPLGSVGNSGAGGKDFGISGKPPQAADMGASFFSPLNPYNNLRGDPFAVEAPGRRSRSSGGGTPGGTYDAEGRELDVDAMERVASKMSIINKQNSGYLDDRSINNTGEIKAEANASVFSVSGEGSQLVGDRNTNTTTGSAPELEPATAQTKPPRVKTQEQKDRANQQAKANRELKKSIAKEGTQEQKERIAKEGLTGRRKSAQPKPAAKRTPAASTSSRPQPSIKIENTGSNTINNGPGASEFKV